MSKQSISSFNLKKQGLHSLRHGSIILLGTFLTLWANVLFAHYLSAADYGNYCVVIRNASFLALILTMGFDVSANRYVSNYFVNNRLHLVKGFLYVALNAFLIASIIFLFVIIVVSFSVYFLDKFHITHLHYATLIIWLWIAVPMAVLQLGMVLLRTVYKADLGFFLGNVIVYAFILLGMYFVAHRINVEDLRVKLILVLTGFSYIASAALVVWAIKKYLYSSIKICGKSLKRKKKWIHVSRSMMAYSVLSLFVPALTLNIIELANTHVSEHNVGVFALAMTITSAFGLIPSLTVKGSVMAWMKPLFKQGQYQKLAKLVVFSNWFSLLFNLLIALAWVLGRHWIVASLPVAYHGVIIPGFFQALSFMFSPSLNANRSMLMMMGHQNKVLWVRVFLILSLSILIPFGVWYDGIIGASVAFMVAQLFTGMGDMLTLRLMGYGTLWVRSCHRNQN